MQVIVLSIQLKVYSIEDIITKNHTIAFKIHLIHLHPYPHHIEMSQLILRVIKQTGLCMMGMFISRRARFTDPEVYRKYELKKNHN